MGVWGGRRGFRVISFGRKKELRKILRGFGVLFQSFSVFFVGSRLGWADWMGVEVGGGLIGWVWRLGVG